MTHNAYHPKIIEDIIHDAKKLLDVSQESIREMSQQDKRVWFQYASAKLRRLEEILNLPPQKTKITLK